VENVKKIFLAEKFELIREYRRPKVVTELNGQALNLMKLPGVFPRHKHDNEDELFPVWHGQMVIPWENSTNP
jgi:hypothetical protein